MESSGHPDRFGADVKNKEHDKLDSDNDVAAGDHAKKNDKESDIVLESHFYQLTGELTSLYHLDNFKLKVLIIVGQQLTSLDGIEKLENLIELWVIEGPLDNANAVNNCKMLKRLYLYSNCLETFPDVSNLRKLQTLWLSGNSIDLIGDLPNELRELNLANNKIRDLEPLKKSTKLEVLYLAGNPIGTFHDLDPLLHLPKLKKLYLIDQLYDSSPVSSLVNYRSYLILKFPQIRLLDGIPVEEQERENTKTYFAKKFRSYNVLYMNACNKFVEDKQKWFAKSCSFLSALRKSMYNNAINEAMFGRENKRVQEEECRKEQQCLEAACFTWEKQHGSWNEVLENELEVKFQLLNLEMKYYGNLNFVDQTKDPTLLNIVSELMNSFVCCYTKRNVNLNSIIVDKVIQIVNIQYRPFHTFEGVKQFVGVPSSENKCFILSSPTHAEDVSAWPVDFLRDYLSVKEGGSFECGFTNSIAIADCTWLSSNGYYKNILLKKEKQKGSRVLVLVNVYNFDDKQSQSTTECYQRSSTRDKHLSLNDNPEDECYECNIYHSEIPQKVVPIFVVEYHYDFQDVEDSFEEFSFPRLEIYESFKNVSCVFSNPKFRFINWQNMKTLNLSRSHISSFGPIQQLPTVTSLDISYNKISNFQEIRSLFCNLETLNAQFNEISSVNTIVGLKKLEELNLKWNKLTRLTTTILWLKKGCPNLKSLDISFNSFVDINNPKHMDFFVYENLPCLRKYNSEWAETKHKIKYEFSVKDFQSIYLSEKMRTDIKHEPKLMWSNGICAKFAEIKDSYIALNDFRDPISINIERGNPFHVFQANMRRESLRWLTIKHNQLHCVEFIAEFPKLEELDLSFNLIQNIDTVFKNSKCLVRLSLMSNYLTSVEGFQSANLVSLKVLNLSNNYLKSLRGLETHTSIEELYVSSNEIKKVEAFEFIKYWRNLKIIDASLNKFEEPDALRNFLIYHVQKLEYINGATISEEEIAEANEVLSGILDKEYLNKIYKPNQLQQLTELTVKKVGLKKISFSETSLSNLNSMNLESNLLTSLSPLCYLKHLKSLCLTNNQISSYGETKKPFESLETLYLNFNNITDLVPLELKFFPKLIALFLQDNLLTNLRGLNSVSKRLQYLILDRNRISNIGVDDFDGMVHLKELFLESNLVNDLTFLKHLKGLKKLFLARNKIENQVSLENLSFVSKVNEITVHGNPICRSNCHYIIIVSLLQSLKTIDSNPVEELTPPPQPNPCPV